MPGIFPVNRHVNNGAYAVARNSLDPQTIHELVVSSRDLMIIHCGDDTVAAELLNIGYTAAVNFHAIGFCKLLLMG